MGWVLERQEELRAGCWRHWECKPAVGETTGSEGQALERP